MIPLGAGGSHDLNAWVITSTIPQYLGQAMIAQLSPGVAGQSGTQEVANDAADGYTLLLSHNCIDMLQQPVENLPHDPMEDFVPVARVNYAPIAIVVRADSTYETFDDLAAAAAENPGRIRRSRSGNRGATSVAAVQVMKARNIAFDPIPCQVGRPGLSADADRRFRRDYGVPGGDRAAGRGR